MELEKFVEGKWGAENVGETWEHIPGKSKWIIGKVLTALWKACKSCDSLPSLMSH